MLHFAAHEGEAAMDDRPETTPAAEPAPAAPAGAFPPKPLVARARDILTKPREEWGHIDAEPASIGGIYVNYVLILAAIPPLAGAIGLLLFGYPILGATYRPGIGAVLSQALSSYVLSLIGVFVVALIIDWLAPRFGGVRDQVKAFKAAAYASTAGWIAGIANVVPQLGWLQLIGAIYGLYLLYLGLPRLMRVPQDRAVPYIAVCILAFIVAFVVIGMVVAMVAGPRLY
jgi:hypothetical protein